MTFLTVSDLRPDAEVKRSIDTVVAKAASDWSPLPWEGEFPLSGFGIRQLRVFDIQSTTTHRPGTGAVDALYWWDVGNIGTAGPTWQDWVNTTTNRDLYVIVEGIFNLSPAPNYVEIWPNPNGQSLPSMPLDTLYAMDVGRGWFTKPFAIQPNATLQIQKKYFNEGATERIGLLGHAVGKRSYLLTRG